MIRVAVAIPEGRALVGTQGPFLRLAFPAATHAQIPVTQLLSRTYCDALPCRLLLPPTLASCPALLLTLPPLTRSLAAHPRHLP